MSEPVRPLAEMLRLPALAELVRRPPRRGPNFLSELVRPPMQQGEAMMEEGQRETLHRPPHITAGLRVDAIPIQLANKVITR